MSESVIAFLHSVNIENEKPELLFSALVHMIDSVGKRLPVQKTGERISVGYPHRVSPVFSVFRYLYAFPDRFEKEENHGRIHRRIERELSVDG